MGRFFGTDGIRGKFGVEPITTDFFEKLGYAVASYFHLIHNSKDIKFIIGFDTRYSGEELSRAFSKGVLRCVGSDIECVGVIPTPALCYLTKEGMFSAGIMISASHNPYEDNGIKIFNCDGFKLIEEEENLLEKFLSQTCPPRRSATKAGHPEPQALASPKHREGGKDRYFSFLSTTFPNLSLKNFKIVLDCAHGATFNIAPKIFKYFGASVSLIGCSPHGKNINENCGALHLENLQKEVLNQKAHLGIAFDGDGDRVMCVDERGEVIDGADILAIWALFLKQHNQLKNNTVVSTSMCNIGVEKSLLSQGIRMIRTEVGDRYILEEMRKNNYTLGGEPSGHLIDLDLLPTGDGILSSLFLCSILQSEGKTLSELSSYS